MSLTIQKFILSMLFIMLTIIYAIFAKYYLYQREETASVILGSIKSDISETSYVLSKSITDVATISRYRAIIDRVSSNNDNILAILIADDNDVLITTDPHYDRVPRRDKILYGEFISAYDAIFSKKGIEGVIRFYKDGKINRLRIIFLFDKEEINRHFNASKMNYLIYFGLLPILLLSIFLIILRYFLVTPLELLRQLAYYQSSNPRVFKIRELEAIRSSMIQTFKRLDEEQKKLYEMARTDHLSGLANRSALDEYTRRLIADSRRTNREFAFLFLDIDHFKTINDEHGYPIGDKLLKNISSKIKKVISSNDFVARVGGDEFVIVLHQYASIMELTVIINRVQLMIEEPWDIENTSIHVSSSVGIALYPKDGTDITSLMQHSSMAMFQAKKNGRAQYHFFTPELNKKVQDTIALDKAMRKALKDDEYELYYQPQTDVITDEIVGVEALIRWISPTKGMIPPDVFIPLAEENGFIIELGDWVLKEAIYQQIKWKEAGMDISISINVSTKQILHPGFKYKLTTLLHESKVDVSKIDVEITEYLFLEQNKNNLEVLNFIHNCGIKISLDDFGTGYSSLSYLKKFPIDILKIDKIFMDDYDTIEGAIFVETIVKMGQTLKMKIIAEGVEEKDQIEYLKNIGCSTYQGYYCSKPLSVKDFENFYKIKRLKS